MNKSRAKSKTRLIKEIIETEEFDGEQSNLLDLTRLPSSTTHNPGAHLGGDNAADTTVEKIVFGKNIRPDGSYAPVCSDWKETGQRKQEQQTNRSPLYCNPNESFRPLAASSFSEHCISSPIALDLSSPLNISNINYPPTKPCPALQQFASTTLPNCGNPRAPVPMGSRTLPSQRPSPARAASQPPPQRFTNQPGASTTFSGFQASRPPIRGGNRTIAVTGLTAPCEANSSYFSQSSSREAQLKQRLEDVENQLARVDLALKGQGIETELSEESQIRLISFLQRRLLDLEAKVGEMEEYSIPHSSDYSVEEDSLERRNDSQIEIDSLENNSRSRNVSRQCSTRSSNTQDTLFKLQALISRRDEQFDF